MIYSTSADIQIIAVKYPHIYKKQNSSSFEIKWYARNTFINLISRLIRSYLNLYKKILNLTIMSNYNKAKLKNIKNIPAIIPKMDRCSFPKMREAGNNSSNEI